MDRLRMVSAITVFLCVVSSCSSAQEARAGVEAAVAQLPELSEFDTIKVIYNQFSHEWCDYGRAHIILGSSLPDMEALDSYATALQSLGWMPDRIRHGMLRTLVRGEYEIVGIQSGPPPLVIHDAVDYAQLRTIYKSIIFVILDFMLPSRDEC